MNQCTMYLPLYDANHWNIKSANQPLQYSLRDKWHPYMPQLAGDPIPLSLSIKTTSTQKYYVSSPVKINAHNSLYNILK
jgi:hypothetical protein